MSATTVWCSQINSVNRKTREGTWHAPDGTYHNQTDYILLQKRFRSGIKQQQQGYFQVRISDAPTTCLWWTLKSSWGKPKHLNPIHWTGWRISMLHQYGTLDGTIQWHNNWGSEVHLQENKQKNLAVGKKYILQMCKTWRSICILLLELQNTRISAKHQEEPRKGERELDRETIQWLKNVWKRATVRERPELWGT